MRVLHLGFQLDCPFRDAEYFREKDAQVFQPFLAFLERNVQKYPEFRVSLQVSGAWLEQAEQYNVELIERLAKLARGNKIDFLAMPYYNSLAFFYDTAEFEAEMWLHKEKIRDLFGATCRVCAFPDLMYNDRLAQAAEKMGYLGVLAGGMPQDSVRRYETRVYDAAECSAMRVMWRNTELSEYVMTDFAMRRRELKDDAALASFRKKLDLATVRGGVVNLFVDAETFERQRCAGVIKFLDDLVADWLKRPENPLVTATELATVRGVEEEISLRRTVSWRGEPTEKKVCMPGLVRLADVEFRPMSWLDSQKQREVLQEFYQLKPEVFRTEDESLIADFCKMATLDRVYAMSDDALMRLRVMGVVKRSSSEVVAEMRSQLEKIQERIKQFWREKQAEIERREVVVQKVKSSKKAEEEQDEAVAVKVNFGGNKSRTNDSIVSDEGETLDALESQFANDNTKSILVDDGPTEDWGVEDQQVEVKITSKEKPVRRILKRIVIE